MKNTKKLLVLISSFLLMVSCSQGGETASKSDSFFNSSIEPSISSHESISSDSLISNSTLDSSKINESSSTISSENQNSSSNSQITSKEDEVVDLGILSIKEVRDYCTKYVTELNSSNIGVNEHYKVTIKCLALNKFDLVKTKKSFGLDVSAPGKVIMGDSSGYIACASKSGNDGTTLYGKVGDYAGQSTSSYVVTGYLSIYLGQPEIYVPDSSFTWNSSLNIKFDSFGNSELLNSVSDFYEKTKDIQYNCAGHGYSKLYSLKSVKCIQKDYNGSVYTFSDGKNIFKAIPIKANSLNVGSTYDLSGMLTTKDWSSALRIFGEKVVNKDLNVDVKTIAQSLTITELKSIKASQDDTTSRFDSYTQAFANVYYADVYVDYYTVNGKYYITVSDQKYEGSTEITNENTAHTTYKMVALENHSCWNISENEISNYCPLSKYLCKNEKVRIFYSLWQTTYTNKQPKWKINLFEDLLPTEEGN